MSHVIYSSEFGEMCPKCKKPRKECICSKDTYTPNPDGIVKVRREVSGRRGKGVITIRDVPGKQENVKELARFLKTTLGCGGSVKEGIIEIQGEKLEQVLDLLKKKGYTVKKIGG